MRGFDDACLNASSAAVTEANQGAAGARACEPDSARQLPECHPNLVSKWERGEKKPSSPALKLLSLVQKHGIPAVA